MSRCLFVQGFCWSKANGKATSRPAQIIPWSIQTRISNCQTSSTQQLQHGPGAASVRFEGLTIPQRQTSNRLDCGEWVEQAKELCVLTRRVPVRKLRAERLCLRHLENLFFQLDPNMKYIKPWSTCMKPAPDDVNAKCCRCWPISSNASGTSDVVLAGDNKYSTSW